MLEKQSAQFEFAADAWDWLYDSGFLLKGDEVVHLEGKAQHLFDFEHTDGRTARLFLPQHDGDTAEARIFKPFRPLI